MQLCKICKFLIFSVMLAALSLAVSGQIAESETSPTILINKRPLIDYENYVKTQLSDPEFDLKAEFLLEASGVIEKDGKIHSDTFKILRQEGNDQIIEFALNSLDAINNAGFFQYAQYLGKITFLISQNKEYFNVLITSPQENASHARIKTAGLSGMLKIATLQLKNQVSEQAKLDFVIINGLKVSNSDNILNISLELDKEFAHKYFDQMIKDSEQ